LHRISQALIVKENLSGNEVDEIMKGDAQPPETAEAPAQA